MEKMIVGIDIDKKTFKVCLMQRNSDDSQKVLGSRSFSNKISGFDDFLQWLTKKNKTQNKIGYVMEATGVYHEALAYFLHQKNQEVHLVLPLKAKHYLKSLGLRSKTDKIDAGGLAQMGLEQNLALWQPASEDLLELRSLTRQIERLQAIKTSFKNQLEAAKHSVVQHPLVLKSLNKMIQETDKQVQVLKKQIAKLIEKDAVLKAKFELFKDLKGVALMTFAVIVSETNGFSLFNNQKQLTCYAGYDVIEKQSGQKAGKTKISKKGNSHIRRILHLAAWQVVKYQVKPFMGLYQRVYQRTGIKMKAYVAVQRKLLMMIYTVWKKDMAFDPDFETSDKQETKSLFLVDASASQIKTAEDKPSTALDELPSQLSTEALFLVT